MEETVGVESNGGEDADATQTSPVVYVKTTATISPVNGKFTTTTVRNVTYEDGTAKVVSDVADGKVHAKRIYTSSAVTSQESNRKTTTQNGVTTTTAYAKYVYGFNQPVVTEEVINSESGPAEATGCCACNVM